MKITFLLPRFHTNIFAAIGALQARGHQVSVFATKAIHAEDYTHLAPRLLQPADLTWRAIWHLLKTERPDLLVIREHGGRWGRFLFVARALEIKCIGYDLTPFHAPRGIIKRFSEYRQGKPWRRITPVLGFDRRVRNPFDIYIPFPVASIAGVPALPDKPLAILCVAKLAQERKRHLLLIDALEALPDPARVRLTLAGSSSHNLTGAPADYDRQLKARIATSTLNITVMEDVPFADMPAFYTSHAICVLPARREPLGIAPVEAMGYGCLPIMSNDVGAATIINLGTSGFTFPADNQPALTQLIAQLLDHPAQLQAARQAALDQAQRDFSAAAYVTAFEQMAARL